MSSSYDNWTVRELKARLRHLGLSPNGHKDALIHKLEERDRKNSFRGDEHVADMIEDEEKVKVEDYLIAFDGEKGMKFNEWVKHFQNFCERNELSDKWKFRNIYRYLEGSALTNYINFCQGCTSFYHVIKVLEEKYVDVNVTNFSEFVKLHFKTGDSLLNYFQTKLEKGRLLGLREDLIIQGLSEGLPSEVKNLVLIKNPTNPQEWLETVSKISIQQVKPEVEVTQTKYSSVNPNYNPNWNRRPLRQNFQPVHSPNPNNFRFPRPNYPPQQHNLPPKPCIFCSRRGILNAYHWGTECTFNPRNNPPLGSTAIGRPT